MLSLHGLSKYSIHIACLHEVSIVYILHKGADTEVLSGTDSIRRLYALTKTTEDPIIHCAASYVLLGVTNISGKPSMCI